ncbi:PIN domain-containing protein [Actinobacteria bacterium YIM 96077]|uniref:Ribonuclease VapC n=1 Tax=Phytoactinopolyspora halophila TaxID=1981511 RepID=A0A329R2C9_9ACTN|nr:PIN domain-containing protein [Phytoactinopolyspora halophila]AYY12039.1 PIN domain-containing protein [Actinobacteria bacterium YIM 96077]RAW18727.1 VapC toxin family PIN domain ribonuclease [Phytoactinopolyspora halophila]
MILVDTGVLVALVNASDERHEACQAWFLSVDEQDLGIPAPLISEACYVIWKRYGTRVESAFLDDLGDGLYGQIVDVEPEDLRRMAQLVDTYTDLPLGGADACVIAISERMKITEVATIDHRHFRVVRPNHVTSLTLLPDVSSHTGRP